MIPVPPLDGSRLADYFMPQRWRGAWETIYQGAPIALAALIIGLQFFGGFLSAVIGAIATVLFALVGVR
jgi:Zn-dependent protease